LGEIAAIITSICWSISSITFTFASHKVGAAGVNRLRLAFAIVWTLLMHLALTGQVLPTQAGLDRWLWLGLSGIVGLVLGDLFLFQAYLNIGPRISTLIMSLAPVISAILAWIFLHEVLRLTQIIGILVTLAGVAIVILERVHGKTTPVDQKRYLVGVLSAVGGATGQALGLILAKEGLSGDFPSISGLAIRMFVSTLVLWAITLFAGQVKTTLQGMRSRSTLGLMLGGSLVGPFIGVWLSIVSIQLAPVGVASTLMALSPIFLIPAGVWIFHEHVSLRAIIGTVVSVCGIVILFLL